MIFKADLLIDIYYKIPGNFLPYRMNYFYDRLLEKVFLYLINKWVPPYYEKTKEIISYRLHTSRKKNNCAIIVSLTSFPARINTTHIAIESIFRQTIKPDRIILWLAKEQFPNLFDDLPINLLAQVERGLEIRFCEDLRSHKKYYYSLKEFPYCRVILFDDDLFCHRQMIQYLLEENEKYPNYIIASRAHLMTFKNGKLRPYRKWNHNFKSSQASKFYLHTSGNGTLIPNNLIFDKIFFDSKTFMKLSPSSDDVWFKANLIRLNIPVVITKMYKRDPISIRGSFKTSLVSHNTFRSKKDDQIRTVFNYFGIESTESGIRNHKN